MKRILFIIILVVTSISVMNSLRTIVTLWQKQTLLQDAKKELITKQKENEELKKQLALVNKENFVEDEARNNLFLEKPGDTTVFIPKDLLNNKKIIPMNKTKLPNWQQWIQTFVGN